MTDGILEIDHLDAAAGAMEKQALLAERPPEVVPEFCVLRGDAALRRNAYGTMRGMPHGES